jgi:cullin-associated NEDD8-dissociated protein 1
MDADTIFEYRSVVTGLTVYLRNKVSTIKVGRFRFRNPPTFLPLLGESNNKNAWDNLATHRDAEYEVEALIDHLTQHPSVAPHISKLLIQRFITSNPSPRYVKVVASAFTTGEYAGKTYSGVYGDLGAAITALICDPEARSFTLDSDVTYGSMREPFLKVIHFLRAFEYKAHFGAQLAMPDIVNIGMNAFAAPTVFGFFLPNYVPVGPIDHLGLVSPEAQLSTAPNIIAYLNGMYSLVRFGVSGSKGFGDHVRNKISYSGWTAKKTIMSQDGGLAYTPPDFADPKQITRCDALESRQWCASNRSDIILGTVETPAACLELCHSLDLQNSSFPNGCCQWIPADSGDRDLNYLGRSGCTPSSKCSACEGDCDRDADCNDGLVCFQRSSDQLPVGCNGGGIGDSRGSDYCVDPHVVVTKVPGVCSLQPAALPASGGDHDLVNLGDSGCTSSSKCSACKGDCDTDDDCNDGLVCYLRDGTFPVPGCNPGGSGDESDTDFCVDADAAAQVSPNQWRWSGGCASRTYSSARQALIDNAPKVIADFSLLLADGRMSSHTKGLLETSYVNSVKNAAKTASVEEIAADAVMLAQEVAMAVPEFHTTALNIGAGARPPPKVQEPHGHKFKAIVVVNFHGGADSYNFLVPYSGCGTVDLYDEYKAVRGNVALSKSELLQIEVPVGTQPCSKFALNPKFINTHQLFENGEVSWVANIGTMIEPMTVEEFKLGKKKQPPGLYGHAAQRLQVQTSVPQDPNAKGVVGRAVRSLMEQTTPYKSVLYEVTSGGGKILSGSPQAPIRVRSKGFTRWDRQGSSVKQYFDNITSMVSHSAFAETYTESVGSSLRMIDTLADELDAAEATTSFPNTDLGRQLKMASRLIKVSIAKETERAVFMTSITGFDTHSNADDSAGPILPQKLEQFDDALKSFRDEMKVQGLWDDVVLMTISDFGRTLSSNSAAGTDHGWGGNNVIAGGGLKGGKIFGKFPPRLALGKGQDLGRGRLLPTMGWEGMWYPVFKWFGVDDKDMQEVLPNAANFAMEQIIPGQEMFK